MNRSWNAELGDNDETVKRMNDASFVFDHDHYTPEMIDKAAEFLIKHGFVHTAFNKVMPLPGTPFYSQLKVISK